MYRAQILLEPEQHQALVEIARRENRSISEIARRLIQIGLEISQDQVAVWERREKALNQLRKIREQTPLYHGDLINEARDEQDDDTERLWNEKSS